MPKAAGRAAVLPGASSRSERTIYLKLAALGAIPDAAGPGGILDEALPRIFASQAQQRHLIFCGPAPLGRFEEVRRLIEKAEGLAEATRSLVRYTIFTGPAALDRAQTDFLARYRVRLVLRPAEGRRERGGYVSQWLGEPALLEGWGASMRALSAAGIDCALDVALGSESLDRLPQALEALLVMEPARVWVSCRQRDPWSHREIRMLLEGLEQWLWRLSLKKGDRPTPLKVLNLYEDKNGSLLNDSVVVSEDGGVQWAGAALLEEAYPKVKDLFPLDLSAVRQVPDFLKEPRSIYAALCRAYPSDTAEGEALTAAIHLSLKLDEFFQTRRPGLMDDSENKTIRAGVMTADLAAQERFLKARLPGLKCVFLPIRTGCHNDCIFCKRKEEDGVDSIADIVKRLDPAPREIKKIGLYGNEPLLHPDLPAIVGLLRDRGYREVEVMTSGNRLSDPVLADALVEAGVTSFAIPLHAAEAEAHDRFTRRPGSFEETMRGLKNLKRHPQVQVYLHANAFRHNMDLLPALERFAREDLGLPFSILPVRPKGSDSMHLPYESLAPSYAEILKLPVRSLSGFPACVMRRVQDPIFLGAGRIADVIKLYVLHQDFVKPVTCRGCAFIDQCMGTFARHLEVYPQDVLEPVSAEA